MMRTLTAITMVLLLSSGSAYAQVKDDGAATPSTNKGNGPKFQDGSGLSGESNTKAAPGSGQNSSSSGTIGGSTKAPEASDGKGGTPSGPASGTSSKN